MQSLRLILALSALALATPTKREQTFKQVVTVWYTGAFDTIGDETGSGSHLYIKDAATGETIDSYDGDKSVECLGACLVQWQPRCFVNQKDFAASDDGYGNIVSCQVTGAGTGEGSSDCDVIGVGSACESTCTVTWDALTDGTC